MVLMQPWRASPGPASLPLDAVSCGGGGVIATRAGDSCTDGGVYGVAVTTVLPDATRRLQCYTSRRVRNGNAATSADKLRSQSKAGAELAARHAPVRHRPHPSIVHEAPETLR
jgi:hypothetical protein